MNGRLLQTWKKKWQGWLAGAIIATACTTNLASAQAPQDIFAPVSPAAAPVSAAAPIQTAFAAPPNLPAVAEETRQEPVSVARAAYPTVLPEDKDSGVTTAVGQGDGKDTGIKQASCSTCGRGLLAGHGGSCGGGACGGGGCRNCGNTDYGHGSKCVPGRLNCCSWCNTDTVCGRLFCGFYECLCCPDPCYDPCWNPIANAAFWTDPVRPVTMTRIRWDAGLNYLLPDKSEFFWARSGGGGKGPAKIETSLRYHDASLYQEIAAKKFSVFFEIPYRNVDPEVNNHAAGFGDMNVGMKSLIFDCELLQIAFQFRTYLPVGNFTKGIGNGHVSLEPSLLASLKLTPSTYLQTQLAEWIPIAGDPSYAGAVMHYHASINQVIWRILPDVPLIGTLEFNGYSYQDGQFSDPVLGQFQQSSGNSYLNAGPGLRLVICNKIDFGTSVMFSLNQPGPEQIYRTEFRMRF